MFSRLSALALGLAVAAPAGAQAYLASNGLVVEPQSATTFYVPYRGKSAAGDFWCAAGDYVVQHLDAPRGTRIWRLSEPPRHSGEGILFSLSPQGAASSTGLATFGTSDGSLSASHAQLLCQPPIPFVID